MSSNLWGRVMKMSHSRQKEDDVFHICRVNKVNTLIKIVIIFFQISVYLLWWLTVIYKGQSWFMYVEHHIIFLSNSMSFQHFYMHLYWVQEEKGMTEDVMAGWHHWLDGCEFEWTQGVGDGQGGLECCNSWGRKASDTTEQLDWLTDISPYCSINTHNFTVACSCDHLKESSHILFIFILFEISDINIMSDF